MSLISLVDSVDVKHHVYLPVYVRLCALVELPLIDDDGDDVFWFISDRSFIVHGSIRCRAHTLGEVFSEKVEGKLKTKNLRKDIKSEKRTNKRTHARTHTLTQPPPPLAMSNHVTSGHRSRPPVALDSRLRRTERVNNGAAVVLWTSAVEGTAHLSPCRPSEKSPFNQVFGNG